MSHPRPANAVILAVDPGRHDGSAVFYRDKLLSSAGATATRSGREAMIRPAVARAREEGVPFVAVLETWTKHRKKANTKGDGWTFTTALRCGEQAGRWLADIEEADPHGIVRVKPLPWRGALWGGRHMTTEVAKARAVQHAEQVFGIMCGDNEAEAICIGHWATHADDVHAIVDAFTVG